MGRTGNHACGVEECGRQEQQACPAGVNTDPPHGRSGCAGQPAPLGPRPDPRGPCQPPGPSYTVTQGNTQSHFWAHLCSEGNLCFFPVFLLGKWSTCWSCLFFFFLISQTEAITTSLSALSQHRKRIKPRRKHELHTAVLRRGPGPPSGRHLPFPFLSV